VFINLTAAYDTIWHPGLTGKLLLLLPDRHRVHMIMEMVGNRSFTLLPLSPEMAKKTRYDASRTASHRDLC